jgi:hypothetical protein
MGNVNQTRFLVNFENWRKSMSKKTKTNLLIDIVIIIAFLVANNPALTGLPMHEWFAVASGVMLVTHLLFHWEWVVNITKTFFRKLFHESRFNYLVDGLLFIAYTAVGLSGLMVSRNVMQTLGIHLTVSPAWREIHSLTATLALLLTALHFAMHWKWAVNTTQRYILFPMRGLTKHPATGQLSIQSVKIDGTK